MDMNLQFDIDLIESYKSNSQKIRVLTEDWVERYQYCPVCGNVVLKHFTANKPVADFYCEKCASQFELKSKESKSGNLGKQITDGAYQTMIERITSFDNPNFFFLTYNNYTVNNLILIPKHFFTPDIIIKRKPLANTARRAGWVGCNINIENIPNTGKIFIVKNSEIIASDVVTSNYNKTTGLVTNNIESRGWLLDTLNCVDRLDSNFTLSQIYSFEKELQTKHPDNNFVKAKLRQQLQILRDKGYIEFTSRGNYRKII